MKKIESESNTLFKRLKTLETSAGIKKEQLFVASGRKIVPELLRLKTLGVEHIILAPHHDLENPIYKKSGAIEFSLDLFKQIDWFNTNYPLIVARTKPLPLFEPAPAKNLELVLPLGDPSNLGAAFRVAEAMNVQKIILTKESANPYHPKVIRSSSGSALRVPTEYFDQSIQNLKGIDGHLDLVGQNLFSFDWPKDFRLLVGEEGQGIPGHLPNQSPTTTASKTDKNNLGLPLCIPMAHGIESLNAVSAVSMALFSYRQKFINELQSPNT